MTAADERIAHLEALLRRTARSLEDFIMESEDPGTEALTVQYLLRQEVSMGPVNRLHPFDPADLAEDILDARADVLPVEDDAAYARRIADYLLAGILRRAGQPTPVRPPHILGCGDCGSPEHNTADHRAVVWGER